MLSRRPRLSEPAQKLVDDPWARVLTQAVVTLVRAQKYLDDHRERMREGGVPTDGSVRPRTPEEQKDDKWLTFEGATPMHSSLVQTFVYDGGIDASDREAIAAARGRLAQDRALQLHEKAVSIRTEAADHALELYGRFDDQRHGTFNEIVELVKNEGVDAIERAVKRSSAIQPKLEFGSGMF